MKPPLLRKSDVSATKEMFLRPTPPPPLTVTLGQTLPQRFSATGSRGRRDDKACAAPPSPSAGHFSHRFNYSPRRGLHALRAARPPPRRVAPYLCRGLLGVGQDAVITVQLLHGRHRSVTAAPGPWACQRHYNSHFPCPPPSAERGTTTSGRNIRPFPPTAPPVDVADVSR